MAIDFPNSPTLNQVFTQGGVSWTWDGTKWASLSVAGWTDAPSNGTTYGRKNAAWSSVDALIVPATQAGSGSVGRNYVHNPLFNIAQRGPGSWNTNSAYTLDRWQLNFTGSTMTCVQNAMTDAYRAAIGDEAAVYSLRTTVGGTAGAGDYASHIHRIEGVRRLSGKTVTVSFWAMAEAGGMRLGVSLDQTYGTGGSPSAPVILNGQSFALGTALSWARYTATFTLPSSAGATFGTNAGTDNIQLDFWYSAGATNATRSGNVGVQSATFNIWGVQLEVGTQATPLEKPDPRYDLSNCMRFYQVIYGWMASGYIPSGSNVNFFNELVLPVTMRATPTVAITNTSYVNASGLSLNANNQTHTRLSLNVIAGGTGYGAGDIAHSADL